MCPAAPANVAVERVPFRTAIQFNIKGNEDTVGKTLLTVPAGKNLTLEYVGASFFGEGNPTYFLRFVSNFVDLASWTVTTGLWQGAMAGHYRTLNQPTALNFAGGEEVFAQAMRSHKGMFTTVRIMVNGYLTDVPCARASGQ